MKWIFVYVNDSLTRSQIELTLVRFCITYLKNYTIHVTCD